MDTNKIQKPSAEEWIKWAQIVIERLSTCVHVYSKPPYEDVFIPDSERQEKNALTLFLLHRIHKVVDEAEAPWESLVDKHAADEKSVAALVPLLTEALKLLPTLSTDMQKMLKTPWHNHCSGRLANELFRGKNTENEGIGTGHPEHGRLPEELQILLEKENIGETRLLREKILRDGPSRHENDLQRWAETNSRILRSAGRIE